MGKIKDLVGQLLGSIFIIWALGSYVYGMYNLSFNDKYSTKELIIGMSLPPYPIYVGTKEFYNGVTEDVPGIEEEQDFIINQERQSLSDFVSQLNKEVNPPVMVDEATKLLSITSDGENVIFTSQLVSDLGMSKEDVQTVLSSMFLRSKIQYCNAKQYEEYNQAITEQGIGMKTIYLDYNKHNLGETTLNKSKCADIPVH